MDSATASLIITEATKRVDAFILTFSTIYLFIYFQQIETTFLEELSILLGTYPHTTTPHALSLFFIIKHHGIEIKPHNSRLTIRKAEQKQRIHESSNKTIIIESKQRVRNEIKDSPLFCPSNRRANCRHGQWAFVEISTGVTEINSAQP